MRKNSFMIRLSFWTFFFLLSTSAIAMAVSVPRISTDELKAHLGEEGYLVLDVRTGSDWSGSTEKITGAERVEPRDVSLWADNYDKEKTVVLYCA